MRMNASEEIQFMDKGENVKQTMRCGKCDRYDYLIAVGCGVLSGLIDSFFVGAPGDSTLEKWADGRVDTAVIRFAKEMGWNPKEKNIDNVNSAIGFLEHGRNSTSPNEFNGFKVNYDQRKSGDVDNLFTIAPKTHHMMSLAHSPDVVGLFFSVLNQFTSTASFIAEGQLVTIATDTFELQGGNLVMKIMCGVANWFGHLMSDVAGSSGSHGRGAGIVMPFYEFFGFCKFGSFKTSDGTKDLSEIAMSAFNQGYDFRFGLAQAIPVIITDLSIRLAWALRRHFQDKKPIKECIPSKEHADLRMMLIVGNGTLCLFDGLDAAIRSGGNWINFFMRLNLIAWFKLILMVLKEIAIRYSFTYEDLRLEFESINADLEHYLDRLKTINYEEYKQELADLQKINQMLADDRCDTTELYTFLENTHSIMQFHSFEEFDMKMQDKNFVLEI